MSAPLPPNYPPEVRLSTLPAVALHGVAALLVACSTGVTLAQSADSTVLTNYSAGFFAHSQPSSAYDMIQLLPGFRLQEGNAEIRGYSGAAGNVLID